ncbi:MAG: YbgC/FadM family acyl-CoA thioesterase [Gammaproteobacteria bacterium]|nr:YbgC/FadM family acyl-CoA thioesterase [Gammaproteobacteria bacterium]
MNIYKLKVFFEDTDAAQVVYHANYLKFCDRARTEWMRSMGVSFVNLLEQEQSTFVVVDINMKFRGPARLGDRLEVHSTIVSVGAAELTFDQRVQLAEDCTSLCDVKVRCAYVRSPSCRPTRLPVTLRSRFKQEVGNA